MSTETTELLDEVIAECIRAEDAGEPLDREKLLAEHSEIATDLREFFADRDRMKSLARPLAPGTPRRQFVPPKIRYFGDYELLEEVARGGMGVVYKARQTSLNRIVAVKLILSGRLADEQDVKRFQTEAEAAANLRHPCIVAVHEVGLFEGQHYFSMDYIEGRNLSEIIREKPLPARQAASYVRQVAEAIHDAHQQGTLHRDLKPSNILIDAADGVHITDFGLAMKVEGDSALTRTGQILGTPSYMPPEQAQGNRALIGPASDVYSLGVVLYELLTGRPPFRTESAVETIRQVIECEPVSPRVLSPHVPGDLETICQTCLEKEPHRRYDTAKALADDLRRFENGEPILARPIGRPARLWRWCRRKPLVASLTAGLLLALLVGTVVSSYFAIETGIHAQHYRDEFRRAEGLLGEKDGLIQQKEILLEEKTELANDLKSALFHQQAATQRATQQTNLAEGLLNQKTRLSNDLAAALAKQTSETARADRQRDRAERYLKKAHQAVDLITQASEEKLRGMSGLESVRRELLSATLRYFQEFLEEQDPDPELQVELAKTYIRVGRIRSLLGAQTEAMADYNHALAIFRRLAAQRSGDVEFQFTMIKTQVDIGYKQSELRRPADAIATYEAAIAQLLPLIDQHPGHRTLKLQLSRAYHNAGFAHAQLRQLANAERYYDLALSIRKPYGGLEQLYNDIGYLQLTMGNLDKALDANQNALEIRSRLLRRNPKNPNFRHDVAGSHNHIGDVHRQASRHSAAITEYQAAVVIQEELVHDYANIARYRAGLANSYSNLASVFYQVKRLDDALSLSTKALEQCKHLLRHAPDDAGNHERHAGAIHEIARSYEARGELETALKYRQEQEAAWIWLAEHRPTQPYYDLRVAQALTAQASLLNRLGRTAEGETARQRATDRQRQAAAPEAAEDEETPKQVDGVDDGKPNQTTLPGDLVRQLDRLKHSRVETRQHAAVVLAQWGPAAAAAVPALIDALHDDDEVVRANASVALSQIGRTAVPALIAVLKQRTLKGQPVRAAERAAIALGRIGSDAREAVPALIDVLGASSPEVIGAAARALVRIDLEPGQAKQAALKLSDLLTETWWWEANWLPDAARGALRRIGPQAVPELLPLLDDPRDAVRHRTARTLGGIGPGAEAAVPALNRLLSDDFRSVRETAAIALAQIGPLGAERLVSALESDDAETRRRAASALGHATGQAKLVVGPLTATVKDRDIRVRTAAAESLAAFGKDAESATPVLAAALKDDERIVHFAADFALRQINPGRAVELLGPPYDPVLAALNDIATLKVGKHDWPQWGGSRFRVNTPEGKEIPHDWNVGIDPNTFKSAPQMKKNIKWQAKLGSQTYGNPVVANGKVFAGTNNGAGHLKRLPSSVDLGCLLCFDEQTGKFLWQYSRPKLPTGRVHDWPLQGLCAAPLVDGDRLWVTTNRCEIVCLDIEGFRDGENDGPYKDEDNENPDEADVVWMLDMIGELGVSPHNMSTCSPITADGRLFVCTSNGQDEFHTRIPAPKAPSFMALDRQTGKVLWTDNSPGENILHGQWASPSYGVFDGQPQVIFPGGDGWIYSFDPKGDGQGNSKLLWKFDGNPKESKWILGGRGTRNSIIAFPAIYDGLVYITMGQDPEHGEGQGHLWCIDPTKRGDVGAELAVDADGKPLAHRRIQAVDVTKGERTIPNPNSALVWHYGALTREEYDEQDFEEAFHRSIGIPVIKDDLLYVADFSGLFHCLNAKTGKPYWTHDLWGAVWGSALVVDGKVYIGDEDGDVAIFRHGRKREMLGEVFMGNSVYSTPIVANNVLFISNKSTLFAIAHDDGVK